MNCASRSRNSGSTASTAPDWMTMLKRSLSRWPINFSTSNKWPVEETGKNSVMPSTTPATVVTITVLVMDAENKGSLRPAQPKRATGTAQKFTDPEKLEAMLRQIWE